MLTTLSSPRPKKSIQMPQRKWSQGKLWYDNNKTNEIYWYHNLEHNIQQINGPWGKSGSQNHPTTQLRVWREKKIKTDFTGCQRHFLSSQVISVVEQRRGAIRHRIAKLSFIRVLTHHFWGHLGTLWVPQMPSLPVRKSHRHLYGYFSISSRGEDGSCK